MQYSAATFWPAKSFNCQKSKVQVTKLYVYNIIFACFFISKLNAKIHSFLKQCFSFYENKVLQLGLARKGLVKGSCKHCFKNEWTLDSMYRDYWYTTMYWCLLKQVKRLYSHWKWKIKRTDNPLRTLNSWKNIPFLKMSWLFFWRTCLSKEWFCPFWHLKKTPVMKDYAKQREMSK